METLLFNKSKTKQCPFCGERIQSLAIKCRYCAEFLNTVEAEADIQPDDAEDNILFKARPSLWGMAGSVIRGLFFLGIAAFLLYYPLERLSFLQSTQDTAKQQFQTLNLTAQQLNYVSQYRVIIGFGLAVFVVLLLLLKMFRLKMIYYEVSADRIEWGRGILDRRVDNLDMFRVVDMRLRRSLLDCIVGVGTVSLITTDKSDPEFNFEKIRNVRALYDIIKNASLNADRQNGVIHLE